MASDAIPTNCCYRMFFGTRLKSKILTKTKAMKPCFNIGMQELLKMMAQILIPLMIGTFTVVIALQQHNLAKENREKDIEIAQQLREQQWSLDEKRRKQELELDEARRQQDLAIAENNHQDSIFNVYIRDLSDLLLMNKFNLSRSLLDSIIRPMTLTILRQLDPSRKLLLLKFLYESKMLRADYEQSRLDLTDADLRDMVFGPNRMPHLSLVGASLIDSTFIRTDLTLADFQRADLTNASFINATLVQTCFYRARLKHVQFHQSKLHWADFDLADLSQSTITSDQLESATSWNYAQLPNQTEAPGHNLILPLDRCSTKNWRIKPVQSVNVTRQCHFIALQDNATMEYSFFLEPYQRLIQRREALFEFYFRGCFTRGRPVDVVFEYLDGKDSIDPIDRGNFLSSWKK